MGYIRDRHVQEQATYYWCLVRPCFRCHVDLKLTKWGRDKMAVISQTIFSNVLFLNENVWILIHISFEFVPKAPIKNRLVLVQIMAWRRPGYKPLFEPMMVTLLTYIYVTRPQWETWMKFRKIIVKLVLVIDGWGFSCDVLRWMSLDLTGDESVKTWCRQIQNFRKC